MSCSLQIAFVEILLPGMWLCGSQPTVRQSAMMPRYNANASIANDMMKAQENYLRTVIKKKQDGMQLTL